MAQVKLKMGRPCLYDEAMQEKADSYIFQLKELGHAIPSRAGLCCFLGISKETSYDWCDKYPDFSDTLRNIMVLQEHMALNGGITGQLTPMIVKLVLANHGYHEKAEIDNKSSDGSMSSPALSSAVMLAIQQKIAKNADSK